jgi:flagellar protein FliS
MNDKLDTYKTIDTMGKSQVELILQVYDGAIKAFSDAREQYKDKKLEDGYEQMEKARRFIVHLYTTLNMSEGGEIAANLGRLYSYIITQIDVSEATKDLSRIDDNIKILENLRGSWVALREQERLGDSSGTNAPQSEDYNNAADSFTVSA